MRVIFRTLPDSKNSRFSDVPHSITWCEALFFDFLFGGLFGHKKQFNANVFLVINGPNFRSSDMNEKLA